MDLRGDGSRVARNQQQSSLHGERAQRRAKEHRPIGAARRVLFEGKVFKAEKWSIDMLYTLSRNVVGKKQKALDPIS